MGSTRKEIVDGLIEKGFIKPGDPPPRMSKLDVAMAKRMADCALLAYEDQETICEREPGSYFFEGADTQGFLMSADDFDILAFRGTEPSNLHDWYTDLKFINTEFRFGKVHSGFNEALQYVSGEIERLRLAHPDRQIYVTGHSLGAAIATLWVASQCDHYNCIAGLYTFGSPRVGTSQFARTFDSFFKDRTWRFQNKLDIATRVPKTTRHVGRLLYFDTYGKLHEDASYWFREWIDPMRNLHKREGAFKAAIANHSMKEYQRLVAAL